MKRSEFLKRLPEEQILAVENAARYLIGIFQKLEEGDGDILPVWDQWEVYKGELKGPLLFWEFKDQLKYSFLLQFDIMEREYATADKFWDAIEKRLDAYNYYQEEKKWKQNHSTESDSR